MTELPFIQGHVSILMLVAIAGCSRKTEGLPQPLIVPDASASALAVEAEHRQVMDALAPLIDAHYIFPEIGKQTIAAMSEHDAQGDYASLVEGEQFASAITRDLRAVSHDKHFALRYVSGTANEGRSREEEEKHQRVLSDFGFVTIERHPKNVVSLRIDCFDRAPNEPGVAAAYAKNMSEVADASALILDLRQNHGGDPMTVALLVSYLVGEERIHLNDFWDRDDGSTWQSYTRSDIRGRKFGGQKPIFVLTSKRTFSGGEEAAYDLQALKRATIIGEPTSGAANPAPRHKISAHFVFSVPSVRVTNAITRTNWEGVGVIPDVPVAADDAMSVAQKRAMSVLKP